MYGNCDVCGQRFGWMGDTSVPEYEPCEHMEELRKTQMEIAKKDILEKAQKELVIPWKSITVHGVKYVKG
tara:strand:+ start:2235 stop:2444 length:210 start_codon:yes stop_codon:yes gene_type:complete